MPPVALRVSSAAPATATSPDVAVGAAGDTLTPADPDGERRAALAWAGFVFLALVIGTLVVARWRGPGLAAAPFDGRWDWRPGLRLVPALGLGAVSVAAGPWLAARLHWPVLVVGSATATLVWAVALAAADGWSRVSAPLASEHEYLRVVPGIDDPGAFLRTYTDRLGDYPVHVKGHPPGMTLLLWAMDRVGLAGPGWAAALVLAGAGLATGSVLVSARAVTGETAARRAAPFVAVAPAALWLATSADAFYAGVIALGCTLLIVGRRWLAFLAGGLVLGSALFLTYGAVPLLAIPLVVAGRRRDPRPVVALVVGALVVASAFAAAGFWWFDGLSATHHFYEVGISRHRPYPVFVPLVNPAVLALAVGPAAAVGLWLVRRGPGARLLLPYAALAAVALADLSGLSKGEVERIWLPFVPWLLLATAALPASRTRIWLAAQVALAVVLQAALRSPW